jgi:hypothetical protein
MCLVEPIGEAVKLIVRADEVVAITEIDRRKVGEGRMGPITRKLQQAFQQTVKDQHARSAGWLTPVQAPAAVGSRFGNSKTLACGRGNGVPSAASSVIGMS